MDTVFCVAWSGLSTIHEGLFSDFSLKLEIGWLIWFKMSNCISALI